MTIVTAAFAQAIRGPVLLVLLGLLALLNQTGAINFAQSWPVLIIAYGIMKLLERLLSKPVQPAPPNMMPPGGLQ
jgi:hypothetical protein